MTDRESRCWGVRPSGSVSSVSGGDQMAGGEWGIVRYSEVRARPVVSRCHHQSVVVRPRDRPDQWYHSTVWGTMSDEGTDDPSEWIHYQEFAEDRVQKYSHMLEQFEVGGPGPPFDFPEPPDFFPPPPPIPGSVEECETFSSHFDNCDISKVKYF